MLVNVDQQNTIQPQTNSISANKTSNPIGLLPKTMLKKHLRSLLISLSAALGSLSLGTVMGYASPAISNLNEYKNAFHVNALEESWVTSIIAIGGLLGGCFGGTILDNFGRQFTLVMTGVPLALSWLIIGASPNVYCMLVGRFLSGFVIGIIDVSVHVFISETSAPSVRGFFGSFHQLAINLGYTFSFGFGIFLPWNWLAIACMFVPALFLFCMIFMPESPRWLLSKGRKDECVDVLQWLRGKEDISAEMEEMQENIRQSTNKGKWKDFREPVLYKPLIIIVGLMFFQQCTGYGAMVGYLITVLASAGRKWNPFVQASVIAAFGFVSNLVSAIVVDLVGRRTILLISSSLMIVSMTAFSIFYTIKYYTDMDITTDTIVWLPVACIVMSNFGLQLGYGPVPYYMTSELFPLKARGFAGGIAIATVWIFNWIVAFSFPHLLKLMHDFTLYWMFTAISCLSIPFVIFVVPETKNKSLEEIEMQNK